MNPSMATPLSVVADADALPEYPIPPGTRLESHYYITWQHRRFQSSRFCVMADPDVGWYGFILFNIAQEEDPVGTLPNDFPLLARLLRMGLDQFQALMKRDITPLYNWEPVRCGGSVRLAHPTVTEIATRALGLRDKAIADRAEGRMRKRLRGIQQALEALPHGKVILRQPGATERISDWIEVHHPGGNATTGRIQQAMEALSMGN